MFPSTTVVFWLLMTWKSWEWYYLLFKPWSKMDVVTLEDEIPPWCEGCTTLWAQTSEEITARNITSCSIHCNAGFSDN